MSLTELTVENLAVIERVRLPVSPGFTVLTGETGAGKSLVVDALALALGARAATDQVRSGTDAARVEAVFTDVTADEDDPLADVLAAGEGMAIIRREVGADGRSVVRVNDRSVTVGGLATLGARLAEIHGQHEQQRLLAGDRQLALLDRFGELEGRVAEVARRTAPGAGPWPRPRRCSPTSTSWRAGWSCCATRSTRSRPRRCSRARTRPWSGSCAAATHAEAIARAADVAVRALRDESAGLDALATARAELAQAAALDERFAALADRAGSLEAEAVELARDVADLGERLDLDPATRAAAEERLALLYDLKRKYGETLEAVIGIRRGVGGRAGAARAAGHHSGAAAGGRGAPAREHWRRPPPPSVASDGRRQRSWRGG